MKSGLIYNKQQIPLYLSTLQQKTNPQYPYQIRLSELVSSQNLNEVTEKKENIKIYSTTKKFYTYSSSHEDNFTKISVDEAEQQYKMLLGNVLGGNERERKKKLLHLMEQKQKQQELIKAGLIREEEQKFSSQEERDLIFSFKPKEQFDNKTTMQKNNFAKLASIAMHIKNPKQKKVKRANTQQCNNLLQFQDKNRIRIDSETVKTSQNKKQNQTLEKVDDKAKIKDYDVKQQIGEDFYIQEKLQTLAESKDNQKQISEEEIDSLFGIHIFNGENLLKMLYALAEINENSLKRSIQQKIKEQQLYSKSLFNQGKINQILREHESSLRNQEKEFKIIKRLFLQSPEEVTNYLKTLYKLKVKKGKISQLMEADFQKINYQIVSEVYPKFINLMD